MSNETLINLIEQILENIKSGNSNIDENGQLELIDTIQKITSQELFKSEAAEYIGVCRATFDNYIAKGIIPKGRKTRGTNYLFWKKSDLDKYLLNKSVKNITNIESSI